MLRRERKEGVAFRTPLEEEENSLLFLSFAFRAFGVFEFSIQRHKNQTRTIRCFFHENSHSSQLHGESVQPGIVKKKKIHG